MSHRIILQFASRRLKRLPAQRDMVILASTAEYSSVEFWSGSSLLRSGFDLALRMCTGWTIERVSMRLARRLGFAVIAAASFSTAAPAQSPDESLKIYAVSVVKTTPFDKPFTGNGIYLGNGAVITAAHVIGRWGFLKNPRVLIAGQDLPAKIVKEGSLDEIDLTLLSVSEETLPVGLRLRRNPLCKQPPRPGESVIVVVPDETKRSHIISPLMIAPGLRRRFNTLISEVAEGSGSGVFDAQRRCLAGIMSRRLQKYDYRKEAGNIVPAPAGFAGYFVPASQIAQFIPEEFRF
jgi:hypothetical protein